MFTRIHRTLAAAALSLAAALAMPVAHAQQAPASAPEATATPAAATPAPVAAPAVTKESVDNPYGIKALWAQGDFVAKGTLCILFIMIGALVCASSSRARRRRRAR